MSLVYMFEKMIGANNNHKLWEKINYATKMKDVLLINNLKKGHIIEILHRIIDRKDNNLLDISIYSNYLHNCLFDELQYSQEKSILEKELVTKIS